MNYLTLDNLAYLILGITYIFVVNPIFADQFIGGGKGDSYCKCMKVGILIHAVISAVFAVIFSVVWSLDRVFTL